MIPFALSMLLGVHIVAGIVALAAGLVAIISIKGSHRHVLSGKSYVIAMGAVVVTSVPLAIAADSPFLLAIAVFSGYLVFAGVRVIVGNATSRISPNRLDVLGHGSMILVGCGMVATGGWMVVGSPTGLGPVLIVFGGIGVGLASRELRSLKGSNTERISPINRHIGCMGGAYIATVTAAVSVNLHVIPPLARWLIPTVVGVPCIIIATRRYEAGTDPVVQHG